MLQRVPAEGAAPQSEEETIVGMLQRVLHPRLKSQLSESNLAVRQVRARAMMCECRTQGLSPRQGAASRHLILDKYVEESGHGSPSESYCHFAVRVFPAGL